MLLQVNPVQHWSFLPSALVSRCKTQMEVNQLHGNLITSGHIHNKSLTAKMVVDLAFSPHKACSDFARLLLFEYGFRDAFLWNAIIRSALQAGEPVIALQVFVLMLVRGVLVDGYTLTLMLKSCSKMRLLSQGRQIHGLVCKLGLSSRVIVQNCLILMYIHCGVIEFGRLVFDRMPKKDSFSYNLLINGYVKCKKVSLARELFDSMPQHLKNVVSWNTMIACYVRLEDGSEAAQELFDKMPKRDLFSWNLMIDLCARTGKMDLAESLFEKMPEKDVVSWGSMVKGFSMIGNLNAARAIFDAMPKRDVISCNAMISGYVNNGYYNEALKVFHDMLGNAAKFTPDNVTLLTALTAAAHLGCIDIGIAIHQFMEERGFPIKGRLGVALIDLFAKCGDIEKAIHLFEGIQEKKIDHWNAVIGGLAIHGYGDLAFDLFLKMESLSVEPDDITFIVVLHACGHSGMVKEGLICFEIMRRFHNIVPKLQHYGCMVDILSRVGYVEEASKFVHEMPIRPNDIIWRTLLSGCTNHGKLHTGEQLAHHLIGNLNYSSSSRVIVSNMYARFGYWEYVRRLRKLMIQEDMDKIPGCSWIELEGTVHEFFAGSVSDLLGEKV